MLRLAALLCLTASSLAQVVTFGVKGGVPLTQAFAAQVNPQFPDIGINSGLQIQMGQALSSATERTLPYIVGPAVGVHLAGPFSVTVEALYTHAAYDYRWFVYISPSSGTQLIQTKHSVSRWEFPVLLKYQVPARGVHPFVAAGVSIRYSRNEDLGGSQASRPAGLIPIFFPFPGSSPVGSTDVGPTIGAGVSFGAAHLRPSVEFRYTRWVNPTTPDVPGFIKQPLAVHSEANQVQFLAGVMF